MNPRLLAVLLLCLSMAPVAHASSAMHCGSRIVAEGDSVGTLIAACGEPVYRDAWSLYPLANGVIADTEEWYYNFGPNQLLRVVRLRAGRVDEIDSDGYGYIDTPEPSCAGSDIREGWSKFRLLLECGEPLTRRVVSTYDPYNRGYNGRFHGRSGFEAVFREEWVYNFGSGSFMRAVTLENGRVAYVRETDRGFD